MSYKQKDGMMAEEISKRDLPKKKAVNATGDMVIDTKIELDKLGKKKSAEVKKKPHPKATESSAWVGKDLDEARKKLLSNKGKKF